MNMGPHKISTKMLTSSDIAKVIESHKQYWFDSFKDFEDKMYSINSHALKRG